MVSPVYPPSIIPHSADGCFTAPDFRRVILESYRAQADMDSNLFARFYNEAIQMWITDMIVIDGRPIICVKSTPLRALSTYKHLLSNIEGFEALPSDAVTIERFPLPFANFVRGVPKTNTVLKQDAYPIRNIGFLDGSMKRRTAYTRYPQAVLLPYTVDIWCRYESHMDYIVQVVRSQFTPLAYTQVSNPFSSGTMDMAIKLVDLLDNSDLERDETEDRLLRITLSLSVEGWMFYDLLQAPTFLTETDSVDIADVPGGAATEHIFTKSFKVSESPPTIDERDASTSSQVPPTQA